MVKQASVRLKTVSPGEVIFSEGYVGVPAMYVIKDGTVEISVSRGDARIVLATLGKGQFFGESSLVSSGPRHCTAKALSYCELQIVEPSYLQDMIDSAPAILKHMLRSLILSGTKKDELLATHENMQARPDILSYAHILTLMATSDARVRQLGDYREAATTLQVVEVVRKCRDITGHTRHHVVATLKRMAMLNLVSLGGAYHDATVNEVLNGAQTLSFNATNIVPRAEELTKHNLEDKLHAEQEMIEIIDLEALTGVSRSLLLRKLAHGEIAEEIFAFRRSEVLRVIAEKGKTYFSKRQSNHEMDSVDDLVTIDKRILFEALSSFDDFDLAKLFQHIKDRSVRDRLFSCMAKAKREEIETLMQQGAGGDAEEIEHIEQSLLETVKALRRPVGAPAGYGMDDGSTASN